MPVNYIAGTFRVIGASPDGDSVRFTPTNLDAFTAAGIRVRANSSGGVQLRLDAIDALETHYTPPHAPRPWEQPEVYGGGAASALLDLLGFSDVVRDERHVVTSAQPAETPGYILTNFADKYGRAVATAYAGTRPGDDPDGALVFLDVPELERSVNYQLISAGWAYPTFYSKLFVDLRQALASAAGKARGEAAHLWVDDLTNAGFTLTSREQLTDELVILPKLFRRLAEYLTLDETGGVDLSGFAAFLEAKADRLFTVPAGQMTHFDTLVQVTGQQVLLTESPEDIVFLEG